MSILSNITGYIKSIGQISPIKSLRNVLDNFVDKVTFGRGLKIWAKPSLREIKAKEDFSEFELANGMKVIFKQSKGNGIDASIRFDSGASKDPKNKSGLAHFLEHIVVSNTKEFGKEIDDVVRINGGYVNAMTGNDYTKYVVTLPKDKLDLTLRILKSYMSPLNYDDQVLAKEKGIVCSELKMTEANPQRKAHFIFQETLFGKDHPLTKDPIGTSNDVISFTKADLDKFHQDEYVSNNATLVISGDFDKTQFKNLVSRHFGAFKPNEKLIKLDASLGIKSSEQKDHLLKDDTLISSLDYVYKIQKFNHKDNLISDLISQALSSGDDSRLRKKLVDGEINAGKAVALELGCFSHTTKDYGHFIISSKPLDNNREANLKVIVDTIEKELADIAANGLQEKEFSRLIRILENREIYKKDFQHADLGAVENYFQNASVWTLSLNYLRDLKSITNDDIKQFVQKYLVKENRYSFTTVGKGSGFDGGYKNALKDNLVKVAKQEPEKILDAQKLDHIKSHSRGISNVSAELNDLQKFQSANGMNVFFKEDHSLPVVFMEASFKGGSLSAPKQDEIALSMLIGILAETGSYNPQTGKRLDKKDLEKLRILLGASFSQGSSLDSASLGFRTLSKNLNPTLGLMNEVLNNSALLETNNPQVVKSVEAELERVKKGALDILEIMRKRPGVKASEKFSNTMYPIGHQFNHEPIEKQIARIKSLTLDDLRKIYKKHFHAKNAKITVVGDIKKEEINSKIVPFLDSWNKQYQESVIEPDYSRIAKVEAPKASLNIVSSDNNEPQSLVMIGNPAEITEDSPDHYPALIANKILGSGMSSRLFSEVREQKGLVYHIGSSIDILRKGCGPFQVSLGCDPRNIKKSLAATLSAINKFLVGGVSPQELELAKSQIKKSFAMNALETRLSTIGTLSGLQDRDKDEAFINNFNKMIDSITVEQVNNAARKFIKPKNFTIVATKPKDFVIPAEEQKSESRAKNMNMALAA